MMEVSNPGIVSIKRVRPTTAKIVNIESNLKNSQNSNNSHNFDNYKILDFTNNNNLNEEIEKHIGEHKTELDQMIKEENNRLDFINRQKEKLKNIELLEKNIGGLYEWKSLFTKNRPITAYTQRHKNITDEVK